MENRSAALNKRIGADRAITLVFVIIEAFIGVVQLIRLFTLGDEFALKRGIHAIAGAAALFMVYLILKRIGITGKPFDKGNIKLLRAAAITVIAGGVLPFFLAMIIGTVNGSGFTIEIGNMDIFIPLIGVTIGIISEIFVYGADLQEDNDLIA